MSFVRFILLFQPKILGIREDDSLFFSAFLWLQAGGYERGGPCQ